MDTYVQLLLFGSLLLLIYKYLISNYDYWQKRNVAFVKPTPFIGNFWEMLTMKLSIGHYLQKVYNQFDKPYFGIYAFNTPVLVLKDVQLVKNVLVKDFQYFSDRSVTANENADSMAANMLFFVKNPLWKDVRTKVTPIFSSAKLKNMIGLINSSGNDFAEYIDKNCLNKKSCDAKEVAAKFTTDVLTSTAFGIRANSFKDDRAQFRGVGRKMFDFNFWRGIRTVCYFFSPFLVAVLKLRFFDDELYNFLRKSFWDTIHVREKTGTRRNDLIDTIIDMKKHVSQDKFQFEGDRVVAQAVQFFAAGFETTSAAISFTLYELALNKDIQDRVRKEIMSTFNGKEIDYDGLQSMKYLQKVVSETLRKYPALPFLDRRCMKDYKMPNSDLIIENGTAVYVPLFALHYDEKHFPNPDEYDPSRFDDENAKKQCYMPFGDGPHNCIGARFGLIVTKIGLIRVLREFEVSVSDDTPIPIEFDMKSVLLQSNVGLPLKFQTAATKAA